MICANAARTALFYCNPNLGHDQVRKNSLAKVTWLEILALSSTDDPQVVQNKKSVGISPMSTLLQDKPLFGTIRDRES